MDYQLEISIKKQDGVEINFCFDSDSIRALGEVFERPIVNLYKDTILSSLYILPQYVERFYQRQPPPSKPLSLNDVEVGEHTVGLSLICGDKLISTNLVFSDYSEEEPYLVEERVDRILLRAYRFASI